MFWNLWSTTRQCNIRIPMIMNFGSFQIIPSWRCFEIFGSRHEGTTFEYPHDNELCFFLNPPTWLISGKFVTAMSMSWTLTWGFNVTFCFVKINPWICFTSIVYDFYILIFKTHHPLFECDQDWVWVLRDEDQILGVSGITISSLSSIKIEYSETKQDQDQDSVTKNKY